MVALAEKQEMAAVELVVGAEWQWQWWRRAGQLAQADAHGYGHTEATISGQFRVMLRNLSCHSSNSRHKRGWHADMPRG